MPKVNSSRCNICINGYDGTNGNGYQPCGCNNSSPNVSFENGESKMMELIKIIEKMKESRISNYVIAGLDSYILSNGNVRLFKCSRNHQDQITPHNHRFDFACLVLEGCVINRVWEKSDSQNGDLFQTSKLIYKGKVGEHSVSEDDRNYWSYKDKSYISGQIYSMTADQVHSIQFSRGASVLFFEGPQIRDSSLIIEPVVDGEVIHTYENREYMFNTD